VRARRGSRGERIPRRLPRAEIVLPIVIALAAVVLIVSEFQTAFEFTPRGGEPLREMSGGERHGYALVVLGVAALILMVAAIVTGSKPAAIGVGAIGGACLLMFLLLDLPDAGQVGPLEDLVTARAEPQEGFWLQAIGSVGLAIAGGTFATLAPDQLQAWARLLGWIEPEPRSELSAAPDQARSPAADNEKPPVRSAGGGRYQR
jgi:hypothetical protein